MSLVQCLLSESEPSIPMILWWAHATHLCYFTPACLCWSGAQCDDDDPCFPPIQTFITRNGTVYINQAFSEWLVIIAEDRRRLQWHFMSRCVWGSAQSLYYIMYTIYYTSILYIQYVSLEHRYICRNSQQYIVWVKIIHFSLITKIIRY